MTEKITLSTHTSGDTWAGLSLSIKLNGHPMDLTAASVLMQLRKTPQDAQIIESWSTASGSIVIDSPADGTISIKPRVITSSSKTLYWDVQITHADGTVRTVLAGSLPVEMDVSRV